MGMIGNVAQVITDIRRGWKIGKLMREFRSAMGTAEARLKAKLSTTYKHKPPIGLMRNLHVQVAGSSNELVGTINIEGAYSMIREMGGKIESSGKMMTVPWPLPENMSNRYPAQRYGDRTTILRYISANRFFVVDKETKEILYQLVRQVNHPQQAYILPVINQIADMVNERMGDEIVSVLTKEMKSDYKIDIQMVI